MAGALVAVLLLASIERDLAHAQAQTESERIEYAENGTAPVAAYTAVDPEGTGIVWTKSGTDADEFELNGGVLTFVSPPNFESPTDTGGNNEYEVTVTASDSGNVARMLNVTVEVPNLDEPGKVDVPTQQPQEDVVLTVTLSDPDGNTSNVTWQWARSPNGSTGWADIAGAGATQAAYTPVADDVDNYLRATASYDDLEGKNKTAAMISANPVREKLYVNAAPMYKDAEGNEITTAKMEVAEDAAAGDLVGEPVTAMDDARDKLTYTLGGTNAASFSIDSGTGQIRVGADAVLNFEDLNNNSFTVTVTATDPPGATDVITVTITVTDVDEAPTITAGDTVIDYDENATNQVGVDYTATDPEDDDNAPPKDLKWSLSGADASKFKIGNTTADRGDLSFNSSPDYEASDSADGDTIYEVTVVVTDSDGMTDSRDVIVRLGNENEDGTVTLSNLQPEVGVEIRAELDDPDGVIGTVTWQWQAGVSDVDGETSATFTPTSNHQGGRITAVAAYTDGHGPNKTHEAESANSVQPHDTTNDENIPTFDNQTSTREVADGTVGSDTDDAANVGAPVTAEDEDVLTYSLVDSTDARSFTITRDTAQIRVASGVTINYETKRSYTVVVKAKDASNSEDTLRVTITVTDVDEAPVISGDDPGEYAENGTGTVSDFNAVDPERTRIVWTLSGNDAGDFSISSTGVLTFNSSPDYENPTDADTNNEYRVTVEASDTGSKQDTREVTVTVTNLDEKGTIDLTLLQPKVGVELEASVTDPDGESGQRPPITDTEIDTVSWQWAKSSSANGPWTNINGQIEAAYTPVAADIGSYLRVAAGYNDGEGKYKAAYGISDNAVEAAIAENQAPVFEDANGVMIPDNVGLTVQVAENTGAGMNVGAPVAARDPDNDTMTYTLSGNNDDGSFSIASGTGQIKVGAVTMLNYEASKTQYTVTVTATDSSNTDNDSIGVTINVTDVDEAPSLSGDTVLFQVEDTEVTTEIETYMATDDEDADDQPVKALTWSLAGSDADDFNISSGGVLTFAARPDYENPSDTGSNNAYDVTVEVTDSDGNTVSLDVTITVTNVNEDGEVTLSSLQPQDGIVITAKLTDPDGSISGRSWEWEQSNTTSDCSGAGGWTVIPRANAKAASYTPVKGDEGRCLRATVSYTDGKSSGQSQSGVSANPVQAADTDNKAPEFPDQDPQTEGTQNSETERSVDENTVAGVNVGDPVAAADDDDDGNLNNPEILTYTLGGDDAGSFEIAPESGQITVGAGTTLDFETKSSYSVTVTATDPSLAPATITVTINVNDVDEAPVISKKALAIAGRRSIDYPENGDRSVATYTAAGPESARTTWTLSGVDAADFTIAAGVLDFRATPNYEAPDDRDRDNEYRITVQARDSGGNTAALDVTVRVANEDEDGALTLSPSTANAGVEMTASLTDLDEVVAGSVSWQWARSSSGVSNWSNIPGATSNAYTPGTADANNYIRATARYTDGHGPGKSENAVSTNAVGGNSTPVFPASETGARSVPEGTAAGTDIGDPVAAEDPGDTLTYTLGGTDAASFDIVAATGQLQTNAALDAATKSTYTVTVTATDSAGASAEITVTITVTVTTSTLGPLGDRYDSNNSGRIEKSEVLDAIDDYFDGLITKEDVLDLIDLYFAG